MRQETIDVCVCTFRRPSLEHTLASIAACELPAGLGVRVVVADNDWTDERRAEIENTCRQLHLDVRYIHAPAQNISIARNACLNEASSEWIAFIDDDEIAAEDWLKKLTLHRTEVDFVFGVSQALYVDAGIPRWVAAGDFHSNRIRGNDGQWNGYTANVLFNREFTKRHELKFDPELGQTGGEDTAFFFAAHRCGGRFGYAPDAVVWENTPLQRATMKWLCLRRFRSGQVHYILQRDLRNRHGLALSAAFKAGICLAFACLRSVTSGWRPDILRGAVHAGVLAAYFGFSLYREYK